MVKVMNIQKTATSHLSNIVVARDYAPQQRDENEGGTKNKERRRWKCEDQRQRRPTKVPQTEQDRVIRTLTDQQQKTPKRQELPKDTKSPIWQQISNAGIRKEVQTRPTSDTVMIRDSSTTQPVSDSGLLDENRAYTDTTINDTIVGDDIGDRDTTGGVTDDS